MRVIKKINCITIAIKDTPENILSRITFYDIDSKPIIKKLSNQEKKLYKKEIKKNITYFNKSYQRADIQVDIRDLDAETSAQKIKEKLSYYKETR